MDHITATLNGIFNSSPIKVCTKITLGQHYSSGFAGIQEVLSIDIPLERRSIIQWVVPGQTVTCLVIPHGNHTVIWPADMEKTIQSIMPADIFPEVFEHVFIEYRIESMDEINK